MVTAGRMGTLPMGAPYFSDWSISPKEKGAELPSILSWPPLRLSAAPGEGESSESSTSYAATDEAAAEDDDADGEAPDESR